ncbi:MAG: Unknown protein [uncultured Sulfurovum sp.]|uniref:Lcl C-terminal domain-containing protein n=1 Tax=uncultured Sulfurovum sp. TaxID=269237 RepID=A0A6S6TPL3_9BACT|nr:MAG: Unknown protein [uncultured Sulfurovum sp.]
MNKKVISLSLVTSFSLFSITGCNSETVASELVNTTPHTNQEKCFDANGESITCIMSGQDGAYLKNMPSYTQENNDIVSDNITNLMWQKTADMNDDGKINVSDKLSQSASVDYCSTLEQGGYSDWRLPNVTSLYSLIDFSGQDVSGWSGTDTQVNESLMHNGQQLHSTLLMKNKCLVST